MPESATLSRPEAPCCAVWLRAGCVGHRHLPARHGAPCRLTTDHLFFSETVAKWCNRATCRPLSPGSTYGFYARGRYRRRRAARFNGADAIAPQKPILQWGRGIDAAETPPTPLSYSVFKDLRNPPRAAPAPRAFSPVPSVPRRCKLFKLIPLIPCERFRHFLRRPAARARHRVMKTG